MNAFKELIAECRAVLAFERELRDISVLGNTNVNVFKLKVDAADAALAATQEPHVEAVAPRPELAAAPDTLDLLEALRQWEYWYSVDSTECNRDDAREYGLSLLKKHKVKVTS